MNKLIVKHSRKENPENALFGKFDSLSNNVTLACGRGANCERVFNGERCSLIATRSAKAGGELLLDYGDESERLLPPQTRRDRLFRAYGFACICDSCRAAYANYDAAELVNGDELRSVKSI